MSDIAIGAQGNSSEDGAFRARTVVLILAIGILGFIATLVLGAYAPRSEIGPQRRGRTRCRPPPRGSARDRPPRPRDRARPAHHPRCAPARYSEDLVVLTPETAATDLSAVLAQRRGKPTLLVLPKWQTVGDSDRTGWVRHLGLKPAAEPNGVLARATSCGSPGGAAAARRCSPRGPAAGHRLRLAPAAPDRIRQQDRSR